MDKRDINDEMENRTKTAADTDQPTGANKEPAADEAAVSDGDETPGQTDSDNTGSLKEELESAKDKYLRLYSEFENFRRRTAKEKLDLIQSANEELITALLPVIDDFDRASLAVADKPDENAEGFLLIHAKLRKVLETFGVKAMEIGKGAEFDADFHDAITQLPAPEPELKGKIVDIIEKGYFLNDKVIRYAKVVVGN